MGGPTCNPQSDDLISIFVSNINASARSTPTFWTFQFLNLAYFAFAFVSLLIFLAATNSINEKGLAIGAAIVLGLALVFHLVALIWYWASEPYGRFTFRHNASIMINFLLALLFSLLYIILSFTWFGHLPTPPGTSIQNVDLAALAAAAPSVYSSYVTLQAALAVNGGILLLSYLYTSVVFGHPESKSTIVATRAGAPEGQAAAT